MPAPLCFDYCSFVTCFEISKYEASNFVLLFQDCFGNSNPWRFHTDFRMLFFYFCKKWCWILIEITWKLLITLDSMDIWTMVKSMNMGYLHLFVFFISFHSVCSFHFKGLLPSWLSLLLNILFSFMICYFLNFFLRFFIVNI